MFSYILANGMHVGLLNRRTGYKEPALAMGFAYKTIIFVTFDLLRLEIRALTTYISSQYTLHVLYNTYTACSYADAFHSTTTNNSLPTPKLRSKAHTQHGVFFHSPESRAHERCSFSRWPFSTGVILVKVVTYTYTYTQRLASTYI